MCLFCVFAIESRFGQKLLCNALNVNANVNVEDSLFTLLVVVFVLMEERVRVRPCDHGLVFLVP